MSWARVFGAAVRKEWRIVRRYPSNLAFTLFWPVMLPAVYVWAARAFGGDSSSAQDAFVQRAGTADVAGFLYVGWAVFMWLTIILWGPGAALRQEQLRGTLQSVFLTPAPRWALLFGVAPAHLLLSLVMFGVVGAALWLGFDAPIGGAAALRALVVILASVPLLVGIGALLSSLVLLVRDTSGLLMLLRASFTVLCGVTYPVVVLPGWAQAVANVLPPTHVIGALRSALLTGAGFVSLGPTLVGLLGAGVVACACATGALSLAERGLRRNGGLERY
jgi:ABC-2 type transport system permease protein